MYQPDHGVLWANPDFSFLVQKNRADNVYGVDIPCPFKPHVQRECPHDITLVAEPVSHPQLHDPLFQVMSPVPFPGVFVVKGPIPFLDTLSQLCSPVEEIIQPFWVTKPQNFRSKLTSTNCAPWVLTHLRMLDVARLESMISTYSNVPRRLVVVTDGWIFKINGARKIETSMTEVEKPETLREVGGHLLWRHMIGERIFET